jgi:hypothetical protein
MVISWNSPELIDALKIALHWRADEGDVEEITDALGLTLDPGVIRPFGGTVNSVVVAPTAAKEIVFRIHRPNTAVD